MQCYHIRLSYNLLFVRVFVYILCIDIRGTLDDMSISLGSLLTNVTNICRRAYWPLAQSTEYRIQNTDHRVFSLLT